MDDVELAEYFDRIGRNRVTADGEPDLNSRRDAGGTRDDQRNRDRRSARAVESPTDRVVATPSAWRSATSLARLAYETATKRGIGTQFRPRRRSSENVTDRAGT